MGNERIVILGNGGAALSAVRAARAAGHRGEIHLVSDSDAPAFNPMLSPYYLKGVIPWDNCFPWGAGFYDDFGVIRHSGSPVVSVDTRAGEVTLANGLRLEYDKCLAATGAGPAIPRIPGLQGSARSVTLRTPVSVRKFEKLAASSGRALIVGASLVGLKAAEILIKRKIHVIMVEVMDRILPGAAHPPTARFLSTWFEEHGADIRLGCSLEGVEESGGKAACTLSTGPVEETDLVAVCAGVRPNLDFVDRSAVETDRAILVNDRMETNVPGFYAAGDVSQGPNALSGRREWLGTWGAACLQGRTAGCNMAHGDEVCPPVIPQNISPFFDWTYGQLGDMEPEGGVVRFVTTGDPREGGYLALAFRDDILTGARMINCTHLAGRLRRAVLQKSVWRGLPGKAGKGTVMARIAEKLNEMDFPTGHAPGVVETR